MASADSDTRDDRRKRRFPRLLILITLGVVVAVGFSLSPLARDEHVIRFLVPASCNEEVAKFFRERESIEFRMLDLHPTTDALSWVAGVAEVRSRRWNFAELKKWANNPVLSCFPTKQVEWDLRNAAMISVVLERLPPERPIPAEIVEGTKIRLYLKP